MHRVAAAALTPSRRDLLVFCHVPAISGDPDSFAIFSVQVRAVVFSVPALSAPALSVPGPLSSCLSQGAAPAAGPSAASRPLSRRSRPAPARALRW